MPGCIEHGVKEWAATGQRPNRDTGLCGEDATVSLSRTPLSVKRMIVPHDRPVARCEWPRRSRPPRFSRSCQRRDARGRVASWRPSRPHRRSCRWRCFPHTLARARTPPASGVTPAGATPVQPMRGDGSAAEASRLTRRSGSRDTQSLSSAVRRFPGAAASLAGTGQRPPRMGGTGRFRARAPV